MIFNYFHLELKKNFALHPESSWIILMANIDGTPQKITRIFIATIVCCVKSDMVAFHAIDYMTGMTLLN